MNLNYKKTLRLRKSFARLPLITDIPNLIDIQKNSFSNFLQADLPEGEREDVGLHAVFKSVFPIYDFNEVSSLEYVNYKVDTPKASEEECKRKGLTYSRAIKVNIKLITREKNEDGVKKIKTIKEQEVYFGEMPLMTRNGTFIINGAERVIVSQLHRSPGVSFEMDKNKTTTGRKVIYTAKIIPYRGSWLDFEFDSKDLIFCRIDRRRKIPVTILLRALGLTTQDLLKFFYKTETILVKGKGVFAKQMDYDLLKGQRAIKDLLDPNSGKRIVRKNQKIEDRELKRIKEAGLTEYEIGQNDIIGKVIAEDLFDPNTGEVLLECNQEVVEDSLRVFEENNVKEVKVLFIDKLNVGSYLRDTLNSDNINNPEDGRIEIFKRLKPGEPATTESAELLFHNLFFNPERYDLSKVGRLKINYKFNFDEDLNNTILTKKDFLETVKYLIDLRDGRGQIDDIDHLGNRRVRPVGELLENQYRIGLVRVERAVRERMTLQEIETMMPHDLINAKPVSVVIKEFFNSSQLSQFMDQTNPLSEVTHKRRLSALGPGGLTRERAGFEVRDVHPTHYGRICPIETPEGPNIGLIASLSTFAKVNQFGFIQTPYQQVEGGKILKDAIRYYSAFEEQGRTVAQADTNHDDTGQISDEYVPARENGEFVLIEPEKVDLKDVSPLQLVSVAASLIPFLQNDDANRALMGANMQRQAVPLLCPEAPLVGTGMEHKLAEDSGVTIIAKRSGWVESVDANRIVVRSDLSKNEVGELYGYGMYEDVQIYNLTKFTRSNQNTCVNQKPIVGRGDYVRQGEIICDSSSTEIGEISLGQNVTVAFMPWGGYNFEDSILISERLVQKDKFTSIHIEELECVARETKLGKEEITSDIPTISEEVRGNLDENGIIRVGAEVRPDDILVGKITPKGETPLSPEEKLLRAIFGEKAGDVKDTSLRVPPGTKGTVIGIHIFSRNEKDKVASYMEEKVRLDKDCKDEIKISNENLVVQATRLCVNQKLRYDLIDDLQKVILPKGTKLTSQNLNKISRKYWEFIVLEDEESNDKLQQLYKGYGEREKNIKEHYSNKIDALERGDDLPPGVIKLVKVYIATKQKISVGDKLAGRHGNKGVISRILPIEDMPYLADGRPVDVVLNPLGVPSRMNVGQILESHLGRAAKELGRKINNMLETLKVTEPLREFLKKVYQKKEYHKFFDNLSDEEIKQIASNLKEGVPMATPVFDGASEKDIEDFLALADCETTGQVQLFDGRTGEAFENKTTVGSMYILKLHHLVDEKIHARSTGPYSLVTQQPLGGKAQFGGQRLGEMEVWAMEAYGAAYCLQEFLTVKSDDVTGRTKMYEAIVKGDYNVEPGLPESFNVLIKELQSLALDIELIKE